MKTPADFAGQWRIGRVITDRLTGRTSRFDGQAGLTAAGDGALAYAETGQLQLAGAAPMTATRRYLWQFAGAQVDVRFADGRPFHSFAPGMTGPGTDHPCGEDLYRVAYDFSAWPRWSARWDVRGPRKDYALHSQYDRM